MVTSVVTSCGDSNGYLMPFVRAAKDMASLHICTGLPQPSSLYKISCAALNGDLCAIHASSEYSGESALSKGKVT